MNNNAKIMVGEVQHNTKLNDLSNILKIRYIQVTNDKNLNRKIHNYYINKTITERLRQTNIISRSLITLIIK